MGNPLKGEVSFKIGDETHKLSYSVEALYRLEKAMDMKIGAIKKLLQDEEQFSMEMLRTLFWAGLLDTNDGLELDGVGPILSKIPPMEVIEHVTNAFIGAFASDEPAGKGSRPPKPSQKSGTGSAS